MVRIALKNQNLMKKNPRIVTIKCVGGMRCETGRFTTSLNFIDMKPCKDFHVRISQKKLYETVKSLSLKFFREIRNLDVSIF